MFIVRAEADEEARTAIIARAADIVTSRGGSWGKLDEWGKRRFAYEIDHMTEDYYYVSNFQASPEALDEVTRVFGITDNVIRYMPIRLNDVTMVLTAERPVAEAAPEE